MYYEYPSNPLISPGYNRNPFDVEIAFLSREIQAGNIRTVWIHST